MENIDYLKELKEFASNKAFKGKGGLSIALIVTQHAKKQGLPLDPTELVTEGGGQVLGASGKAVQSILERHGIQRVLSAEGGRTSRGSLSKMRKYVSFLNGLGQDIDLERVEKFWIERVREFFAGKPFRVKLDGSRSLRTIVRDVLNQALERQKSAPGMQYTGAVLQHLVGAKLDCALGPDRLSHHNFSTADAPSGRSGDFFLGDVVIHVTTSPSEAAIRKCIDNLNDGLRPMLITLQKGLAVAEGLADNFGVIDRIDIFEIEQFVALNLYEIGEFGAAGRKVALQDMLARYNEIIESVETDPSLKIEFHR